MVEIHNHNSENSFLPKDELYNWQNIVDIISDTIDVPVGLITRVAPPYREIINSSANMDNPYNKGHRDLLKEHFCDKVIKSGDYLHVSNASKDIQWENVLDLQEGMISYMGYPLLWPDGDVFGTISVMDTKKHVYDKKAKQLMTSCKKMIESQLHLYHKYQELMKCKDELESIINKRTHSENIIVTCSYCKKIRDDDGNWENIEEFLRKTFNFQLSHGICNECSEVLFRKYS